MNKISKFIKKNYKFIIGFVLGLVVAGTSVYAANTIYSSNVTYDNSNSGLDATNVQDALDETYTKCFPPTIGINKIIELYNDGPYISDVTISTNYPKVYLNTVQKIMLDGYGNYRYYGKNVNNYVKFNDELWRIIGVFPDIDDGTGKKETRIKIIRSESIGDYSYDSSMELLDTLYYNSQSGSCYNAICDFTEIGLASEARSMIDDAKYASGDIGYCGELSAYGYYEGEMPFNWTRKIGLITPSDFVFARDYTIVNNGGKINNNWLSFLNDSWTMVRDESEEMENTPGVNFITDDSRVEDNCNGSGDPTSLRKIFPVAYLKAEVIINGGTGTESDPYTLKL